MDHPEHGAHSDSILSRRGVGEAVWALALSALVFACYGPALHGRMVWDDAAHVIQPELQSWLGLARIWFEPGTTQQYYPVLYSAFWIEHRLWGDAVSGYHLINVIQHLLAAGLFATLLRRLGRSELPAGSAWLAAVLFAVHPVAVESVAWISEQKNTLSLVLYLAAAHAYLSFESGRRRRWYLVATGLFVLAIGAKSVTGSLPAALLVIAWWRRGKLDGRRDVIPLLPWFALALAMGLMTAGVERRLIGAGFGEPLQLWQRALLAGRVVWFYLGKLVWPADLIFVYPRWSVAAAGMAWLGWLAGAIAVTAGAWTLRRWSRGPLAAWLFYVGSLFPALGFIDVYPFRYSYVADHFQYLPMLGVCTLVAAAIGRGAVALGRGGRISAAVLSAVLVVALAWGARAQSGQYRDSETLYRATLTRNPSCWLALNNLGLEYANSPKRLPEAIELCRAATLAKPDLPEAHLNLGLALARSGRPQEAVEAYASALRLRPDYPEAREDLGLALTALGRVPEAIECYQIALRQHAELFDVRCALANLLRFSGRPAEAVAQFRIALRFETERPDVWVDYGAALAAAGELDAAQNAFERALTLRADFVPARLGRATVWAAIPARQVEAEAELRSLLRERPGLVPAQLALAALVASAPERLDEALACYRRALELSPEDAVAHYNLAVLLAQRGDLDGAQAHWEAALRARPDFAEARRSLQVLAQRRARQ